jgi:hypothetical protein
MHEFAAIRPVLATDIPSCLFYLLVDYKEKMFYNIGPWMTNQIGM